MDIWISRGTEWSEIIKQTADKEFTEQTGIAIRMNILPTAQLSAGSINALMLAISRSEERRVGKECRSRWSPYH